MHQVCRKYQGLHWEPPRSAGIQANLRALVNVDVQGNPQPLEADTLAVAFEAGSHLKLVGEMTCSSLVLRRKSLQYACLKMSAPREIACFLEAGIVASLTMAGRDEDSEVRLLLHALMAAAPLTRPTPRLPRPLACRCPAGARAHHTRAEAAGARAKRQGEPA